MDVNSTAEAIASAARYVFKTTFDASETNVRCRYIFVHEKLPPFYCVNINIVASDYQFNMMLVTVKAAQK